MICGVPLIHPTGSTKDNLTEYMNKAACCPGAGRYLRQFGTRYFPWPGQWNVDVSIFKDFLITERLRLQFRCELFNLLNHANFALASDTSTTLNMNSATFGQITSTSVNARLIQFALRLTR